MSQESTRKGFATMQSGHGTTYITYLDPNYGPVIVAEIAAKRTQRGHTKSGTWSVRYYHITDGHCTFGFHSKRDAISAFMAFVQGVTDTVVLPKSRALR
jgi:hypothetical protein